MSRSELGVKISSALLQQKGEISLDEIKAIPFVDSDLEAELIVNKIFERFNVKMTTEKKSTKPFLEWVTVIKLKE